MRRLAYVAFLVFFCAIPVRAQDKPSSLDKSADAAKKLDVADVLSTLQKAYARSSAKELILLGTSEFQKRTPAANLEGILRAWKARYGKWEEKFEELDRVGTTLVYGVQAEHGQLRLRLGLDAQNRIQGIGLTPVFLDALPATPTMPVVQERMTEAIKSTLVNFKVPSISVALIKGDQIVWTKAFGMQNVGRQVQANSETAYITGSILKIAIATALMEQVDAGKLDLDAPVKKYLHGLEIPNPFEKDQALTTRHLLSHHGGIPNGAQMVNLWRRDVPLKLDDVVQKRVRVTKKPGDAFQYSNYGYSLAGYLLGQLTDLTFERALKQTIFEPLEMTRTTFEPSPALAENMAFPYENSFGGKGGVAPAALMRLDVYPAGDAFSTPTDMAHFLIPHLNEGKYLGKQVLSARSVKEMATVQFAPKDARSGIGLGWMISYNRGRKLLWHNGAVPGFFTYIAINPEKRSGVVLFSNKYSALEAGLGLLADPLVDLRELAIELLDRLPAAPKS
jgi:CubicO group peptidase (beta-lactamase class C family)